MAPPGTMTLVHKKVEDRHSWDYHCKTGWYIGPALNHYRCVQVYIPSTHSVVIADTVNFIEEKIPIPNATIDDYLKQSIGDIVHLIKKRHKMNMPTIKYVAEVMNAFQYLNFIFQKTLPA